MVLICNNNILSIDTFHKHRCEEKAKIKDIVLNFKKIKEKYKETPEEVKKEITEEELKSFLSSFDSISLRKST